MNPIKEIDHEVREVREVRVFVRQYVWPDGVSSYSVLLASDERELTEDRDEGGFDHMPTDRDIEGLPYIKPRTAELDEGLFYILTGPYKKGPYPSRREARSVIRRGEW